MDPFNHQLHTIEAATKHQFKISKTHHSNENMVDFIKRTEAPEHSFTISIILMLNTEVFKIHNKITNATAFIKLLLSREQRIENNKCPVAQVINKTSTCLNNHKILTWIWQQLRKRNNLQTKRRVVQHTGK